MVSSEKPVYDQSISEMMDDMNCMTKSKRSTSSIKVENSEELRKEIEKNRMKQLEKIYGNLEEE